MSQNEFKDFSIIRKIYSKFGYDLLEARDKKSNKVVWLKVLSEGFAEDESRVRQFFMSARVGKLLDLEEVVKAVHYGQIDDKNVIICEPIKGLSLSFFVHERFPLPFNEVTAIVVKITEALRKAHLRGVVHGMLNPDNIYVTDDGQIRIDDFGSLWLAPFMRFGEIANGTPPYYFAPEVYFGAESVDGRADIYSLGVLLFKLLTDDMLFNGNTVHNSVSPLKCLSRIHRAVPQHADALEKILSNCLELNPDNRYQNLSEFLHDLKALQVSAENGTDPDGKKKNRHPLKFRK